MSNTTHTFNHQKAEIAYTKIGNGEKILLAFHGFGQTKTYFKRLGQALSHEYTIYCFDLFFHGESTWNQKDTPLSKTFWAEAIQVFCKYNNINTFEIIGFSMGGKFSLATLESFPQSVKKIMLIAPDGIKTSFWYSLATYPVWARRLFKKSIFDPTKFYSTINLMGKLKIMDKGILKFATSQMDSQEKRRRVYYSWIVFKELKFNMENIASILNKNKIPLEIYLGKYDKIITQANMNVLLDKVEDHKVFMLETGHNKLIDEVADYLDACKVAKDNHEKNN